MKSRIYHKIANIKKEKEVNIIFKDKNLVSCLKYNNYNFLPEEELIDVTKYEVISDHIRNIGEKMGFKLESIKK